MSSTIQIVPKHRFADVEVIVNDYSAVANEDIAPVEDTSVKQCYAIIAGCGKDNTWLKMSSRAAAENTFGKSNFKEYGQPYMQALNVLDQNNSSAWIMRVMPENATFSNVLIYLGYKIDTAEDYSDAHDRKFRIKFVSENLDELTTKDELTKKLNSTDHIIDAEGYKIVPFMAINSAGRGKNGNLYGVRLSQNISYEKEFGIKMYNYEVLYKNNGLKLVATYVGANVTSPKYTSEITTLIDDVIDMYAPGDYPIEISVNEDTSYSVYEAYVEFAKELHSELEAEYAEKVEAYGLPADVIAGIVPPADATEMAEYLELTAIDAEITATADANIPDVDEFDLIYGREVGSTEMIAGLEFPEPLTDDIDITAEDYDPNDYTSSNDIVDFSATAGISLKNGGNGYFDNPRIVENEDGTTTQWTFQDEVDECYKKAYAGVYDSKILSKSRTPITVFWDANYSFEVKNAIAELAEVRDDCRVMLDAGFVDTINSSSLRTLIRKYAGFNHHRETIDIESYWYREPETMKKCRVTCSFYLSAQYVNHVNIYGEHIPFVKEYATVSGYIKNTVTPVVEEYMEDIKDTLVDNRFNFFECVDENVFRRAVQNTRQKENTDLLQESNSFILYNLKRLIRKDAQSQLYNFADESIRQSFCEFERAKYASWVGEKLESFDINFSTSKYEFENSILHLYIDIVFRGLTLHVIAEIDINKRTYASEIEE